MAEATREQYDHLSRHFGDIKNLPPESADKIEVMHPLLSSSNSKTNAKPIFKNNNKIKLSDLIKALFSRSELALPSDILFVNINKILETIIHENNEKEKTEEKE